MQMALLSPLKFRDPRVTARGEARAEVALSRPETLWFNTGTLCNITCRNCYIDSSPRNDALQYLTLAEVVDFLDQITARGWPVTEIGFTGGEPFMNPDILAMIGAALGREYRVLVLTNAMRPLQRPRIRAGLLDLRARHGAALVLRVSLDHPDPACHDAERGPGAQAVTLAGMDWLCAQGFRVTVAGRSVWGGAEAAIRADYARLFQARGYAIDATAPQDCVIFPEMDASADIPEITTACWDILGKHPDSVMCASSRMVVHHKGAPGPAVTACTLLPYDPQFTLGTTLAEAEAPVRLNHPHCARFCVLGGASCSG